jgi:hypothetical protein
MGVRIVDTVISLLEGFYVAECNCTQQSKKRSEGL